MRLLPRCPCAQVRQLFKEAKLQYRRRSGLPLLVEVHLFSCFYPLTAFPLAVEASCLPASSPPAASTNPNSENGLSPALR